MWCVRTDMPCKSHRGDEVKVVRNQGSGIRGRQVVSSQGLGIRDKHHSPAPDFCKLRQKEQFAGVRNCNKQFRNYYFTEKPSAFPKMLGKVHATEFAKQIPSILGKNQRSFPSESTFPSHPLTTKHENVVIAGVGGQGILFTSKIIGEAALESNMNVLTSEIHGMAQRGGAVVSTVKIGNTSSPLIADGEADIVLAFEPAEALRAANKMSENTTVIINTNPVIPFPVTLGKEKYPKMEQIMSKIKKRCRNLLTVDANRLAQQAGSGITMNTVMIGALSRFSFLSKKKIKETIKKNVHKKYVDVNMRAFELGYRAASSGLLK